MKYTVITGASSGIGYEAALAFASRGKNLVLVARRQEELNELKLKINEMHPELDVVIRRTDLSVTEDVYKLYESLQSFQIETWINNAGFGNFASIAEQNLNKIETMLHVNIEALTILSSLLFSFEIIQRLTEHSLLTFHRAADTRLLLMLLRIALRNSM
ncbi:oxidoreductase [Bacillus cereus VD184]|uniref:Oxidoreductase n=1 Tax=Bacillus cereus VD184 TaxID=1053242 RepID=A0A9W5RAC8_BACCE|nr:oxidoreductase [Bacillus cereus VD184]